MISVGPGKEGNTPQVMVGQTILFKKYGPTEVEVDGEDLLLLEEDALLKVEDSNAAANFHEITATTTVASEWETLTFDYSAINTANSYDKLVLIFDNEIEPSPSNTPLIK